MSYKEQLEKAKQELATLSTKKAVIEEKIKNLAESLNLDLTKDLTPQIDALRKSTEEQKKTLMEELESITKELESLDEQSSR